MQPTLTTVNSHHFKMDTEELIKKCRAIRLIEEAEGRVIFKSKMKTKGEKIIAGCLIGKVVLNRGVNAE